MRSIHLFRNLPEVKAFESGDYIFRKGEPGNAMYMVIEGEIDLVVGREIVETAAPGSFIGEMALIDDAPRSASARAKGACRVFPIDNARFQVLVKETPTFALDVMKALALRLRRTNARITARPARKRASPSRAHARRSK